MGWHASSAPAVGQGGPPDFISPNFESFVVHHQVVIVGGGEAGLIVSRRLLKACPGLDVGIIEPSEQYDCQRFWLMVGSGVLPARGSRRETSTLIPHEAHWVRDTVQSFDPAGDTLTTVGGVTVSYDFLVVAPGIQLNWDRVQGLREAVGRDGICSAYAFKTLVATWDSIRDFAGGVALFTQPSGQIKSPTGPLEMCYLAEEHFRRSGIRDHSQLIFTSGETSMFQVPQYSQILDRMAKEKGVAVHLGLDLIEVHPASHEAVFCNLASGEEVVIRYDLLHVAPPMGPCDFVAHSVLADEGGWVDVDPYTLRHSRFPNVFGLGDASSLPCTKTAAAIRQQAPILVTNLLAALERRPLTGKYDGGSNYNIVTGYESILRAELDYNGMIVEAPASELLRLSPQNV